MTRISSKMRNRLALLHAYVRKRSVVPGGPMSMTIESTTRCNLSCPMCLRERIRVPAKDMELVLFRKIIDEAAGFLELAVPYGLGEPLMNPEIFDMIAFYHGKFDAFAVVGESGGLGCGHAASFLK